jgi:hypothetical protein
LPALNHYGFPPIRGEADRRPTRMLAAVNFSILIMVVVAIAGAYGCEVLVELAIAVFAKLKQ